MGSVRSSSRLSGWRLDAAVTALSVLMIAGIALDFRAHASGISFEEEGFFTPEHVFFYSMFLGIAAVLGVETYRNRRSGVSWIDAVPPGYRAGVAGVLLFGFGGGGDFVWHNQFGFETGVEGLTSPTHLMLAIGAAMFLASPLRATWRRRDDPRGIEIVPALVSASLVLAVFVLFTTYANPLIHRHPSLDHGAARRLGVLSFLVFPSILVGAALVLVRRFDLPPGGLTLVFLVPAVASATPRGTWAFVLPVAVAGLLADALVRYANPGDRSALRLRAFGFVVPATFVAGYLVTYEVTRGIAWTVHIWTGTIVLAGLAGLLLTYLVRPDGTESRTDG